MFRVLKISHVIGAVILLSSVVCMSLWAADIPAPSQRAAFAPVPAAKAMRAGAIPAPAKRVYKTLAQACAHARGKAAWQCGLDLWKEAAYKSSAAAFDTASQSGQLSEERRSAAAYWAARSFARLGKKKDVKRHLIRSQALASDEFYGMLSAHALKQPLMVEAGAYPDLEVGGLLYDVDPALVHAIIRQESMFNASARSSMGATGLMQIMPRTARYVAEQSGLAPVSSAQLSDPKVNLDLGQRYIQYLLDHGAVDGDLIALLVAYNAGPGNLRKWDAAIGRDDLLLFIEIMPSAQTRDYVRSVMGNYWAYRAKAGRAMPTLAAIAEGKSISYFEAAKDLPFKVASIY